MKKYTVTGAKASFSAGAFLGLTKDQHAARQHAVDFVKGQKIDGEQINVVQVNLPVEFKNGEAFYAMGEINKAQLQEIAPASTEEKKPKGKGKPASPAAAAEAGAPAEKGE